MNISASEHIPTEKRIKQDSKDYPSAVGATEEIFNKLVKEVEKDKELQNLIVFDTVEKLFNKYGYHLYDYNGYIYFYNGVYYSPVFWKKKSTGNTTNILKKFLVQVDFLCGENFYRDRDRVVLYQTVVSGIEKIKKTSDRIPSEVPLSEEVIRTRTVNNAIDKLLVRAKEFGGLHEAAKELEIKITKDNDNVVYFDGFKSTDSQLERLMSTFCKQKYMKLSPRSIVDFILKIE